MRFAVVKSGLVSNIVEADSVEVVKLFIEDSDEIVSCTEERGVCYIGGMYVDGMFRKVQPYASWIYDEQIQDWIPPVPFPSDSSELVIWDEDSLSWVAAPTE